MGEDAGYTETTTLGWRPSCECHKNEELRIENLETVPALVLDCFMGSGTTAVVAAKLNRNYTGIEINPDYIDNHITIRVREAETGIDKDEARQGQKGLFE